MGIILILTGILLSQSPDGARKLKLSDALVYAVKNNRTLKESKITISQLESKKRASTAIFDTQVTSKINFMETRAEPVAGQFMNTTMLRKFDYEAGIGRLLPTGGMAQISFSGYRQDQDMELSLGGAPQEINTTVFSNAVNFVLSHPLLKGFGTEVTKAGIEKAAVYIDAEKVTAEAKIEVMIRDIVSAFWDLRFAWRQWDTLKSGIDVLKSQLKITQALLLANRAKTADLLAVKAALAQREADILSFRTSILSASIKLKTLMGMDISRKPYILKPTDSISIDSKSILPDELVKTAIKRSKDLEVIRKKIKALNYDVIAAENSMLPRLDLTLSAGPKGDDTEFTKSIQRLIKFDAFTISAGVSFSMSVENTAAKTTLEQIKLAKTLMKLQEDNLRQAIAGSAILAADTWKTSLKKIEAGKLSVKNARLHLDNEKTMFSMGRGTNHSVLLRLTELDQAKLTLLQAEKELVLAITQVKTLAGTLLKSHSIKLTY
ncbi:MAG: TolC family protein [Deltaproteobacteria bacterium]|nr:TolC family protein [Deltaproteobacteria bacterium]